MGERIKVNQRKADGDEKYAPFGTGKSNTTATYDSLFSEILHLQRTIGNRAVTRLIQSGVLQSSLNYGELQYDDFPLTGGEVLQREVAQTGGTETQCTPSPGIPNTDCDAYEENSWWLPNAYVNNATCACSETPNEPSANCVRKFLQDRLASAPGWLKFMAVSQKNLEIVTPLAYQLFVQTFLTPRIYQDHVDAYRECCCPSGPAAYPAWIGVTLVPLSCSAVGESIRQYGSCHGTPGEW